MKNCLLIVIIICFTLKTPAQIIYTDVIPDAIISTYICYTFHLANPSPSYLGYGTVNMWFHLFQPYSPNEVLALCGTDCQIMVNNITAKLPFKLQLNDTISSDKTWADVSYNPLNIANTQGLWLGGVSNKYLGIRFKLTPGGNWMYGWARLDVDAAPDSFTVKDYAYNSETGSTEILAGQTSNTGIIETKLRISSYCFSDPASNSLIIHFANPEKEKFTISIYNINGQLVHRIGNVVKGEVSIENKNWTRGIYFYKLQNEKGIFGKSEFVIE